MVQPVISNETLNGYWLIKLELGEAANKNIIAGSKRRMRIFPNPLITEFHQTISIILNDPPANAVKYTWQIYNILGEKVYDTETSSPILIWDARNNRSKKLASGRYFISVQTGKKTFYTSFTVVR